MKINKTTPVYIVLLLSCLLFSCYYNNKRKLITPLPEDLWQIAKLVTQNHSYNERGLLDSTVRVENHYVDGQPGIIWYFLILKKYDKSNNLIREYTIDDTEKVTALIKFQYDERNNIIKRVEENYGLITKVTTNEYNSANQKIKSIEMAEILELPSDSTLEDLIANAPYKKKKRIAYDTTTYLYQYDNYGNLIKEVFINRNGLNLTTSTIFKDSIKQKSWEIAGDGDTISTITYKKEGPLVVETYSPDYIKWYKDNRIVMSILKDKETNFKAKETFKYDSNGNLIEEISYN